MVEPRQLHEIWIEQCEAARTIKDRYGLKAAFDYLVGEKLLSFTEAASEHRAFAQELPRFVSEVRRMFTAEEIVAQLARIEREQSEKDAAQEEDDPLAESPMREAARARQFAMIKELLTAPVLARPNRSNRFALANSEPQMFVCEGNVIQLRPCAHAQLNRWISLFVFVAGRPTNGARLLMCDHAANARTRK